jgi:hypothetical protein
LDRISHFHHLNAPNVISIEATSILTQGDIRDCIFEIDLRVVLDAHRGLTSKSVLIPFFQKTSFNKLTVYCDHLPPWFEHQLAGFKLAAEAQEFEDYVKVTIVPND